MEPSPPPTQRRAPIPEPEIERSLDASVKDVAAYGQMVGFGEAWLGAYAVALGAGSQILGWLGTLPPFIGALLQPLGARLVDRTGRRRLLYLTGAVAQGLTFVPICVSVFLPREIAFGVLLVSVTVYFAGVHFSSPAWNSVMGDLVPPERRGHFFGVRASAMVLAQWVATVAAGIGLELFKRRGHELHGFAVVFAAALAARAISVAYLARMAEPPYLRPEGTSSLVEFARGAVRSNFGRFVLFVASMNFAVAVSGPYFTLYMLRDLHFTYVEFMVSQAVIVIAQILVLQRWGRLSDRIGNRRILVLTAVGVTLIPMLWQFARSAGVVWVVQAFAGIAWGGFNLAAANFLFDLLPTERRASGVAHFNLTVGVGVLLGGLGGIAIVDHLPGRYELAGIVVRFFSPLQVIMLVSGLLRLATVVVFLPRFREVREVPAFGVGELLLRSSVARSIAEAAGDFLTWYRKGKSQVAGRKSQVGKK